MLARREMQMARVSTHASVRRRPLSTQKSTRTKRCFNSRLREEATRAGRRPVGAGISFHSRLREEATLRRACRRVTPSVSTHASVRRRRHAEHLSHCR